MRNKNMETLSGGITRTKKDSQGRKDIPMIEKFFSAYSDGPDRRGPGP